jgi:4,5-DOPA dioxygenase extradiol
VPAQQPVVFVAHGAPPLLDDGEWMQQLREWAERMPRPASILVLSPHWDREPPTLGATRPVPLLHDFFGFPERFYRTTYPAPGAPELAARVRDLLARSGESPVSAPERGLDHGAYVPLAAMYPKADVPVLQLSMPGTDPRRLLALGRALAPLRREGVLVMPTGFLTHNLRRGLRGGTPEWAAAFDAWAADALERLDLETLLRFARAPGANEALPTTEHFVPIFVAVGAAGSDPRVRFPIDGFWMDGSFSKRSVQFDA